MTAPRFGAQLYTVREFAKTIPDIAQTFKKIREIGFKGIQISGFGPVDPKEVAKLLADSGLTVACTHMGWGSFQNDLDKVIETHRMWNCTHPAIGGLPGEYFTPEGLKKFLDELAPIVEKLRANGMDFSYHNHHHELAHTGPGGKPWLGALYETASPDLLKAEIDTYWIAAGGGSPVAWLNKVAGRMPVIHLKDMIILSDREIRMCEIGEGNLDWAGIHQAAKDGGCEWALIEQDNTYGKDPFEALALSYRNLKAMGWAD